MDKELRNEIRNGVIAEIRRCMEGMNEKWVSAETLCEHVQGLRPRWLERHGMVFNRTRAEWTDGNGKRHAGSWMYPLHEIKQMVADGRIKELVVE